MWQVEFAKQAIKNLDSLGSVVRERVVGKLVWTQNNFDNIRPEPLHYDMKGLYKIRVGDWRIVYEIRHGSKIIFVQAIDHRKNVYKR